VRIRLEHADRQRSNHHTMVAKQIKPDVATLPQYGRGITPFVSIPSILG
jgi:hypothetical protein